MRTAALLPAALLSLALPRGVSAETRLVSACSSTLSDSSPPVLEPLRAVIGDQWADLLVGLLGHSAASKFLISDAGSSCLANMNGTALGEVLAASTAVDTCANALAMLNVPLVQNALGNLSVSLSTSDNENGALDTFIEGLGLVDEGSGADVLAVRGRLRAVSAVAAAAVAGHVALHVGRRLLRRVGDRERLAF